MSRGSRVERRAASGGVLRDVWRDVAIATGQRRDRFRDSFFRRQGIAVLRFTNQQVIEHTSSILELIRDVLHGSSPLTP